MPNDDEMQRRMDDYARRQAELDQMHTDYEAIDAAEYELFNAEMDERDAR